MYIYIYIAAELSNITSFPAPHLSRFKDMPVAAPRHLVYPTVSIRGLDPVCFDPVPRRIQILSGG